MQHTPILRASLAFWFTLVIVYTLGDSIDSVTHLWGARPFQIPGQARNNVLLGIFAMGEGWHANHHAFPSSARHGLLPGQLDGTWLAIRLLQMVGIARKVIVPRDAQVRRLLNPDRAEAGVLGEG